MEIFKLDESINIFKKTFEEFKKQTDTIVNKHIRFILKYVEKQNKPLKIPKTKLNNSNVQDELNEEHPFSCVYVLLVFFQH